MPRRKTGAIPDGEVRVYSDYQRNWSAILEPIRRGRYEYFSAEEMSIHGEAPKGFLRLQQYRPGLPGRRRRYWQAYIAKVPYKCYPNEAFTEHLITRIGQAFGACIADSQVRMVGHQVRFLSKFFLKRKTQRLTHGIEIFERYLRDKEFVEEIAESHCEKEMYTFQTVLAAIKVCFPDHWHTIMPGMVELLTFDALVGNNDRHPLNWGVVEPELRSGRVVFSPIYDTARGLFWQTPERVIRQNRKDRQWFESYIRRTSPQIGWDGRTDIGHFDLVGAILAEHPEWLDSIRKFTAEEPLQEIWRIVRSEFADLMSTDRIELIMKCLEHRHRKLCDTVKEAWG